MDRDRSLPSELPQAYGAAYEAFAARWTPARRALGRMLLRWLLATPPMNSVEPRGPGGELEWRLITTDEWDAMRRALADVIKHYPNDELITMACLIKDFHATASQLLPSEVIARLRTRVTA